MSGYGRLPDTLLDDQTIPAEAKVLFAMLTRYAGRNGDCWPSQKTLAERLGRNPSSVKRYIVTLIAGGYLEVVSRGRGHTSNRYTFKGSPVSPKDDSMGSNEAFYGLKTSNSMGSLVSPEVFKDEVNNEVGPFGPAPEGADRPEGQKPGECGACGYHGFTIRGRRKICSACLAQLDNDGSPRATHFQLLKGGQA